MTKPLRVVVGFSGGVTSAWCLGWALRTFQRNEVIALWHDTKEEHPDTYRFLHEMAAALGVEIVERSDGRSVTQLFRDEGMLGNNQNTMCSRVLKAEPGARFVDELLAGGFEVVKIVGYSARERIRIDRMVGHCDRQGIAVRFPIVELGITKQQCADWCLCTMGVRPSEQYEIFEHANCEGCVKGGARLFSKDSRASPAHLRATRTTRGGIRTYDHSRWQPRSSDAARARADRAQAPRVAAREDRNRRLRVW